MTLSRIDASRCSPLALRSSVTSAIPSRRASRGDATATGAPSSADLAAARARRLRRTASRGSRSARSRAGPRSRAPRPARTSKSTPSSTRRQPRRAGTSSVSPRTSSTGAPSRAAGGRNARRGLPPDHRRDHAVPVHLADRRGDHVAPVAQHGDPVGQRRDLVEPVRDVDDAHAVGRELPDDAEEPRALRRRQRRGRLVHDQDARVERQRLGDLDELLLADAQARDPRLRVEVDPEPLEQAPPGRDHRCVGRG